MYMCIPLCKFIYEILNIHYLQHFFITTLFYQSKNIRKYFRRVAPSVRIWIFLLRIYSIEQSSVAWYFSLLAVFILIELLYFTFKEPVWFSLILLFTVLNWEGVQYPLLINPCNTVDTVVFFFLLYICLISGCFLHVRHVS